MTGVRKRRHDPRTAWLYAWVMLKEFRWTIVLAILAVAFGGMLYHLTPHAALHGARPSPLTSLYGAWMALFAQSIFNPPETWYLAILAGVYPLFGFVLIGEGIVRFGLLMLSRRRGEKEWMKVMASTYRDHVVLCGVGRLGIRVLEQLVAMNAEVVALEKDANCKTLPAAKATGVPLLVRDMTDDEALIEAGVPHARAIVIATNDDIANLEVALDARRMNPKIRIAMRMFDQKMAEKLGDVFGLNVFFSQSSLAAPAVAAMTLDTHVLASFKIAGVPHVAAELTIEPGSSLAGRSVGEVEAAQHLRILARTRGGGGGADADSPPAPNAALAGGDLLVVHVAVERIAVLSAAARGKRAA